MNRFLLRSTLWLAVAAATFAPTPSRAHCDRVDGPVAQAAHRALETGNVNLILVWVRPEDEPLIRDTFQRTLTVRALSPAARELADLHLLETLVRVHRAGEGAPYTGLKPAGHDIKPAIAAADLALDRGAAQPLVGSLTKDIEGGIRGRFERVLAARRYAPNDVEAGRRYVAEYVEFIHFVEALDDAAGGRHGEHAGEGPEARDTTHD
jgi:hypothetical protein